MNLVNMLEQNFQNGSESGRARRLVSLIPQKMRRLVWMRSLLTMTRTWPRRTWRRRKRRKKKRRRSMKRRRKRKRKNEPFFYETDNFIKMLLLIVFYLFVTT